MNADQWRDRTALVTGGAGFIGAHFVAKLSAAGANVISVRRPLTCDCRSAPAGDPRIRQVATDLSSTTDVDALFRAVAADVDTVIHCACVYGNSEFKRKNTGSLLDVNTRITSNVLNGARDHGVPTVVMMSSTEIYSPALTGAIREEDDFRARPDLSVDGYTLSKIFAELLADTYRQQFGMKIVVPRPTNVYGPGDSAGRRSQLVVPAMLERIASGLPIRIWGDGRQRRSFIYVKDLVSVVLQMVAKGSHDVFNVSTPTTVSMLELARLLSHEYGVPERIELQKDKPGGSKVREFSTERMFEVIDFAPRSLRSGIAETVQWYRRTHPPGQPF